jgi:hypothetical protein
MLRTPAVVALARVDDQALCCDGQVCGRRISGVKKRSIRLLAAAQPGIPYVESVFQPGDVPHSDPSPSLLQRGVNPSRSHRRDVCHGARKIERDHFTKREEVEGRSDVDAPHGAG